ncbi:MAG: hypothetical protein AB7O98_12025 [Hyphomonadaceae bacterium]
MHILVRIALGLLCALGAVACAALGWALRFLPIYALACVSIGLFFVTGLWATIFRPANWNLLLRTQRPLAQDTSDVVGMLKARSFHFGIAFYLVAVLIVLLGRDHLWVAILVACPMLLIGLAFHLVWVGTLFRDRDPGPR